MTDKKDEKVPNYSLAQVAALLASINIADLTFESQKIILSDLAETEIFSNKNAKQLTAKLAHLSGQGEKKQVDSSPVYVAKIYTTKRGEPVITKADLLAEIARLLDVDSDIIASLHSATKSTLLLVIAGLTSEPVETDVD